MDETSLSTVQHGQGKVVGLCGENKFGRKFYLVVCVNAAGKYVSLMVIYKRKRMKIEVTNDRPPGLSIHAKTKAGCPMRGLLPG